MGLMDLLSQLWTEAVVAIWLSMNSTQNMRLDADNTQTHNSVYIRNDIVKKIKKNAVLLWNCHSAGKTRRHAVARTRI